MNAMVLRCPLVMPRTRTSRVDHQSDLNKCIQLSMLLAFAQFDTPIRELLWIHFMPAESNGDNSLE